MEARRRPGVRAARRSSGRTSSARGCGTSGSPSSPPATPPTDATRRGLSRLLRAGVRLEWLRALAVGPRGVFGERYDLEPVPGELAGAGPARGARGPRGAALDRLAAYCSGACSNIGDKGCVAAIGLVDAGRELLERPPGDVDQLAAALFALPVKDTTSAPGGAKGNWGAAHGGKDELQTRYREAVARCWTPARPTPRSSPRSPWRSPTRSRAGRPRRSSRWAASTSPTCWAACATCWSATSTPGRPSRRGSLPPGGRVPGHRPAAGRDRLLPLRARAGGARLARGGPAARQAVRGRRPQAVHLPLPPRRHRHVRPGQAAGRGAAGRDRGDARSSARTSAPRRRSSTG